MARMPHTITVHLDADAAIEALRELIEESEELCPMCEQKFRAWLALNMKRWLHTGAKCDDTGD